MVDLTLTKTIAKFILHSIYSFEKIGDGGTCLSGS